ncbi:substrate-binding periplasmic protein [Rhodoferax aquaticus]|nr:transporter substrate-binding domain-containing protein [Rhodoferax aquaticus]
MNTFRFFVAFCLACVWVPLAAQESNPPKPVVTVALMQGNAPFNYADAASASGQSGLFIELLDAIFKQLKLPYEVQTYPWARAQSQVQAGRSDFMVTVPTPERLQYAEASAQAVFLMHMQVFTLKDHPRLEEIKSVRSAQDILSLQLIPISNLGNGWHKANIDVIGIPTTYGTTDESAAKMLVYKRGDILIDSAVSMPLEIKRLGLDGKIVAAAEPFAPLKFHLLISKRSPYVALLPKVNQAIATLTKNGTLERLAAKYAKLD